MITLCTIVSDTRFKPDVIARVAEATPHDELIVADCSLVQCDIDVPHKRLWFAGYNLHYGGALNQVVAETQGGVLVYFSSTRTKLHDASWIDDMVSAVQDESVGMAGTVLPCELSPLADGQTGQGYHVQGGCWSARVDVLHQYPYCDRFPQVYSDVELCQRLLRDGYTLRDVPTIRAVPEGVVRHPYKIVVDYAP